MSMDGWRNESCRPSLDSQGIHSFIQSFVRSFFSTQDETLHSHTSSEAANHKHSKQILALPPRAFMESTPLLYFLPRDSPHSESRRRSCIDTGLSQHSCQFFCQQTYNHSTLEHLREALLDGAGANTGTSISISVGSCHGEKVLVILLREYVMLEIDVCVCV
mmetsp:Transcript_11990/g.19254  ORF Transcript_11990/g.19254 Transcript_11990/m.19254 type:complete len:162 (-) Transcript_11990:155-640(-)